MATQTACALDLGADSADTSSVGVGVDATLIELGEIVADVVVFDGTLVQDTTKPAGTPRRLLDVSRICDLGWKATVQSRDGIAATCRCFMEHRAELRGMA